MKFPAVNHEVCQIPCEHAWINYLVMALIDTIVGCIQPHCCCVFAGCSRNNCIIIIFFKMYFWSWMVTGQPTSWRFVINGKHEHQYVWLLLVVTLPLLINIIHGRFESTNPQFLNVNHQPWLNYCLWTAGFSINESSWRKLLYASSINHHHGSSTIVVGYCPLLVI